MSFFPYYPGDHEAIRRAERLDPPGTCDKPEMCDDCGLELADCERGFQMGLRYEGGFPVRVRACVRCSVCNAKGKCEYVDCGANEACSACPEGGHTKDGDCLYNDKAVASVEDLHLEEGMDDVREARHE